MDLDQPSFFDTPHDHRKRERLRHEQAELHALLNPEPRSVSVSRAAILRSFVYMYFKDIPQPDTRSTDQLLNMPLSVFGGRSLQSKLELDHDWRECCLWMKEVRQIPVDQRRDMLS